MDSENTAPLTKMDKIRIVVEYNGISPRQKFIYLKKNGIDKETIEAYQKEAASALGIKSNPTPAPPKTKCERLIDELQSSNEIARRNAVKGLGVMRHRALPALDSVIDRMLNDPVDSVRSWSAWSLTRIDPRNPDVVNAFMKGLTEDKESLNTRNWCVVGLSVSDNDQVKAQLLDVMQNGEPFAQFASIEVLSRMGVETPEFIERLGLVAESENESIRQLIQETLDRIQSEDKIQSED